MTFKRMLKPAFLQEAMNTRWNILFSGEPGAFLESESCMAALLEKKNGKYIFFSGGGLQQKVKNAVFDRAAVFF